MDYLRALTWPATWIIIAFIAAVTLMACVESSNRMWENFAVACVQNGGQLIGGQCLK